MQVVENETAEKEVVLTEQEKANLAKAQAKRDRKAKLRLERERK